MWVLEIRRVGSDETELLRLCALDLWTGAWAREAQTGSWQAAGDGAPSFLEVVWVSCLTALGLGPVCEGGNAASWQPGGG